MLYISLLPLVLASASPRRYELLSSLGLEFELCPSCVEEPLPDPDESAPDYALRAARIKAESVASGRSDAVVLAADTVVAIGESILGKPADSGAALEMMRLLCSTGAEPPTTHLVVTGCCLLRVEAGRVVARREYYASTAVDMGPAPAAVLAAYASRPEPLDKAGGYAIQGLAACLVRGIRGSYTNVVGLPLAETMDALLSLGAIAARGV